MEVQMCEAAKLSSPRYGSPKLAALA